ncbi:MAG: hypothetical protein J5825_08220 [Lachnospiraceae bacterium]|nr:hypothetical protein [Lachnospiraceae bacterium]
MEKYQDLNLKELMEAAGAVIDLFRKVLIKDGKEDRNAMIVYACALAGYSCHQAVKAENGVFAVVSTKDDRRFFLGDDVNFYLLSNPYSVYSFLSGWFEKANRGRKAPDPTTVVAKCASSLGKEGYRVCDLYPPEKLYTAAKECWDGIYENVILHYCPEPEKWPVLFAIVLQNILLNTTGGDQERLFNFCLEIILYVSKMDDDSL